MLYSLTGRPVHTTMSTRKHSVRSQSQPLPDVGRTIATPPPAYIPAIGWSKSSNMATSTPCPQLPRTIPYHYVVRPKTPSQRSLTPKLGTPRSHTPILGTSPMKQLSVPFYTSSAIKKDPISNQGVVPPIPVIMKTRVPVVLGGIRRISLQVVNPLPLSTKRQVNDVVRFSKLPHKVLTLICSFYGKSSQLLIRFGWICRSLHMVAYEVMDALIIQPSRSSGATDNAENVNWVSLTKFVAPYTRGQYIKDITISEGCVGKLSHLYNVFHSKLYSLTTVDVRGLHVSDYEEWKDNWLVDLGSSCPKLEVIRCGPQWLHGWCHRNTNNRWWKKCPNFKTFEIGSPSTVNDPHKPVTLMLSESFCELVLQQLAHFHCWVPLRPQDFARILVGQPTSVLIDLTINCNGNTLRPYHSLESPFLRQGSAGTPAAPTNPVAGKKDMKPTASPITLPPASTQNVSQSTNVGLPPSDSAPQHKHKMLCTLRLFDVQSTRPEFVAEIYNVFRSQISRFIVDSIPRHVTSGKK
eukprot:PhF_6_TR31381/c0_g1_i1/m.45959